MKFLLLLLSICASALSAGNDPAPAKSATTQAGDVVELRLLGPQSDATKLQWQERTPRLSWGHVFKEMRIVVVEPTGRRFEVSAVNAFATAYKGTIRTIEVRPAWPKSDGPELADRLERIVREWDGTLNDEERASLAELRKMGVPPRGSTPGMWGYRFRLPGDVTFHVRIQGTRGEGWFAVFQFGVPLERYPLK
jgi:hypothetical protein